MLSDRVRVTVSNALDEGACTDPDQMAGSDQSCHPVAAVTAVGQVAGESDTIKSDQSKTQELVHHRSVAWLAPDKQVERQSVDNEILCDPWDPAHRPPDSALPTGSGALGGESWPDNPHPTTAKV